MTSVFVYTTFYTPTEFPSNVPSLLTHYTPPAECLDRWVIPPARDLDPSESLVTVYSTRAYSGDLVDILYTSCQPLAHIDYFSPGVCPEAYTLAGAVVWQWGTSTGFDREWTGYCCRIGMEFESYSCTSTFSTSLHAFAPLTISTSGVTEGTPDVVYQYQSNVKDDEYTTFTNMTTLSTGIAHADPIYVAFKAQDLSLFPSTYATSVARHYSIPFTPTPAPGSSPGLPGETNPPSPSSFGLSAGAKAGIGVGAAFAAAGMIGVVLFLLCLRKRRRRQQITVGTPGNDLPEMIDAIKERPRPME